MNFFGNFRSIEKKRKIGLLNTLLNTSEKRGFLPIFPKCRKSYENIKKSPETLLFRG